MFAEAVSIHGRISSAAIVEGVAFGSLVPVGCGIRRYKWSSCHSAAIV